MSYNTASLNGLPDIEEMNEFISTADTYMEKVVELRDFITEWQPVIEAVSQLRTG
jgi:hypothetical protein